MLFLCSAPIHLVPSWVKTTMRVEDMDPLQQQKKTEQLDECGRWDLFFKTKTQCERVEGDEWNVCIKEYDRWNAFFIGVSFIVVLSLIDSFV